MVFSRPLHRAVSFVLGIELEATERQEDEKDGKISKKGASCLAKTIKEDVTEGQWKPERKIQEERGRSR